MREEERETRIRNLPRRRGLFGVFEEAFDVEGGTQAASEGGESSVVRNKRENPQKLQQREIEDEHVGAKPVLEELEEDGDIKNLSKNDDYEEIDEEDERLLEEFL